MVQCCYMIRIYYLWKKSRAITNLKPIFKKFQEQKDKMIIKARDQEAKHLGITFKPELNPHSVRLLKEVWFVFQALFDICYNLDSSWTPYFLDLIHPKCFPTKGPYVDVLQRTKSPLTLDIIDESGSTSPRNSSNCCMDLSYPRVISDKFNLVK